MEIVRKTLSGAVASAAAYGAYLLGGWDAAMKIMFLFMLLDYATGLLTALLGKSPKTPDGGFWSQTAFLGLTKKLLMVVVVMMAAALDRMLGLAGVCRFAAIGFYVSNEGLSLLENAALLGVPLPQGLRKTLTVLKQRYDEAVPTDEEKK